jgi:hypothetical protein
MTQDRMLMILAALIILAFMATTTTDEALAECQKGHSRETCLYATLPH